MTVIGPLPCAQRCPNPDCGSERQRIVSVDDADSESSSNDDESEDSSHDDTSDDDENSSSDWEDTSGESPYSSSDYSGASSGGTSSDSSGGLIVGVCVVIGLLLLAIKGPNPQSPAVINSESQHSGANRPTPTYTQPNIHFFENTIPGTYNMSQAQSHAQPNMAELETQGVTRNSEQSSDPMILPADPSIVRCLLPGGIDTLLPRTECRERIGVIIDEK